MNLEINCRLRNNKNFEHLKKDDVHYLDCNYKNKNYNFIFNNIWYDNDDNEIFNHLYPNVFSEKNILYCCFLDIVVSGKNIYFE